MSWHGKNDAIVAIFIAELEVRVRSVSSFSFQMFASFVKIVVDL